MDWHLAIEKNREALKRIVAGLVAMAALAGGHDPEEQAEGEPRRTLPRHLHRAILRLLRPAESAARRLIIALAFATPPVLPPFRVRAARAPKPRSIFVRPGVGTGVVLPRGAPVPAELAHLVRRKSASLSLPLVDPLPRWGLRRRSRATDVPRIGMAGGRPVIAGWRPPALDDPLDAARLGRRLAALSGALDDLPAQALRFARWQARRRRALAAGRRHRVTPLRGGRPPGGRLARFDPDTLRLSSIRDVDEILARVHGLAHDALARDAPAALRPDTS